MGSGTSRPAGVRPLRGARRRRLLGALAGPLGLLLVATCTAAGCLDAPDEKVHATYRDDPALLYAPHQRDGVFFTPWNSFAPSLARVLRFGLSRNPFDRSRPPQIPLQPGDGSDLARPLPQPRITWVGHATMAIHDGNDVVVTDPNFAKRMVVVQRKSPPGIPLSSIPADAMGVISHSHNDHLDAGTIDALPASMHWFVPLGLADWFRQRGRDHVVELDWWQSATDGRWTITCLPAQHWSRRIEHGTNRVLWCSWLLDSGTTRYFFAGDTGYFHGFREYGRRFAPIDVAIMPIGAYEPRWFMHEQHVNPAESWQAFRDLGARWMVPMHWGTFDLAFEPLDQPPKDLMAAVDAGGGDRDAVRLLPIGGHFDVPPREAVARAPGAPAGK